MNQQQQDARNWNLLREALNEEAATVLIDDGTEEGLRVGCSWELELLLKRLSETGYVTEPPKGDDHRDYFEPCAYGPHDARGDGPRHYVPAGGR